MKWRAERILDRLYRASEFGSDTEISGIFADADRLSDIPQLSDDDEHYADNVEITSGDADLASLLGQSLSDKIKKRIAADHPHLINVSNTGFQTALQRVNYGNHVVYEHDVDDDEDADEHVVNDIIQWLNESNNYLDYIKE